jgi:hypothetical protein
MKGKKKPIYKRAWFWLLMVLLTLPMTIVVIGGIVSSDEQSVEVVEAEETEKNVEVAPPPVESEVVELPVFEVFERKEYGLRTKDDQGYLFRIHTAADEEKEILAIIEQLHKSAPGRIRYKDGAIVPIYEYTYFFYDEPVADIARQSWIIVGGKITREF